MLRSSAFMSRLFYHPCIGNFRPSGEVEKSKRREQSLHHQQIGKRRRLMATKPTFEQAQLHLQVFEERREPRLRQARDWFFANCFANTWEDAMRIAAPGS